MEQKQWQMWGKPQFELQAASCSAEVSQNSSQNSRQVNHLPSANWAWPRPNSYRCFARLSAVGKYEAEQDKLAAEVAAWQLSLSHHLTGQTMCTASLITTKITAGPQTGPPATIHPSAIFIKQITATSSKWEWSHCDLPVPLAVFAKKRGYKAEQLWGGRTSRQHSCSIVIDILFYPLAGYEGHLGRKHSLATS